MKTCLMKNWLLTSIQGRLALASVLLLPLICGALAWVLERAYSASLLEAQHQKMTTQAYALIASAELESQSLWLPELVTDDRLNQAFSNHYAFAFNHQDNSLLWKSLSAQGRLDTVEYDVSELSLGDPKFLRLPISDVPFFHLHYLVEWEDGERVLPFRFVVLETQDAYRQAMEEYRASLWFWLSAVALALIALQFMILKWGLRPIAALSHDLSVIQKGESDSLKGNYPLELQEMTDSINRLISHEAHQRERYRSTLADLAHSIKNPSAIISSALNQAGNSLPDDMRNTSWLQDIEEQNERIDKILSYQLTRAVGGVAAPFNKAVVVKPLCDKICAAMGKVYHDKSITLACDISGDAVFRGDEGDLMELLGNLIDNAFKYGKAQVNVHARAHDNTLRITIEDDGPGISDAEQAKLVRRGQRADTTIPGQGIGLAVVNDIIESYGGALNLSSSELGGLSVELAFSWDL